MTDTRRKLLRATIDTLRDRGISGTSARTIAAAAGVNQALVFYHFGSVADLIDAACRSAAAEQVERYQPRFRQVSSLAELLLLGQELHAEQQQAGNLTVLTQVLAGARQDDTLARAAQHALGLWIAEIEVTLERLLGGSSTTGFADTAGLARAVAATFVGLELYRGADRNGANKAVTALQQLSNAVHPVRAAAARTTQ
jgi:AcrR family transcriptional regulator